MELKITAGLITKAGKIQLFDILVTEKNCFKVKKKLELEREKTLEILRQFKQQGKIKSVSLPRNSELQNLLDEIVEFKQHLDGGIEKIKEIYFK